LQLRASLKKGKDEPRMGERFAVTLYIMNSTIMQAKILGKFTSLRSPFAKEIGLDMLDIFWRPCRCPGSKYSTKQFPSRPACFYAGLCLPLSYYLYLPSHGNTKPI
jgi:hypothetical protein